ncbi:MAG TPA: hypothetical protein ENO20_03490 [Bacteroides sp.]|nr:hypothetical protein [Bacteroides sp.]
MYYLVVKNLGVERCVDRNEEDIYQDGMCFDCRLDLHCPGTQIVREIEITCNELPDERIRARVLRE